MCAYEWQRSNRLSVVHGGVNKQGSKSTRSSSELCCVACREIVRLEAIRQLYDMVPKDKDFLV